MGHIEGRLNEREREREMGCLRIGRDGGSVDVAGNKEVETLLGL